MPHHPLPFPNFYLLPHLLPGEDLYCHQRRPHSLQNWWKNAGLGNLLRCELLADNITLLQQLETMQGTHPVNMIGPTRPRLREVSTLTTWLYCFLAYTAIITSDATTRNLLAYARLIMREALRHNNNGWLDYDRSFRQQAAVDPSLPWNTLVPGLQASMILGNPTRQGIANQRQQCTLCRGFDHARSDCALSYLHPYMRTNQRNPYRICTSWNKGNCVYPGSCSFRHVCATCQLLHKARDCLKTPEISMYKQSVLTPPPNRDSPNTYNHQYSIIKLSNFNYQLSIII